MQTEAFRQEMNKRNGVEGTISELVRAHGARRSRYRGLAKNQLQAAFIGATTNLKRLAKALVLLFLSRRVTAQAGFRILPNLPQAARFSNWTIIKVEVTQLTVFSAQSDCAD